MKSKELLRTGFVVLFNNFWFLGMVGAYTLFLFYPQAIGNIHARVIISQFIIFVLPGFLLYKLIFDEQNHDIFEKLTFSFLFSCFVFFTTGSIAYFFRLPLLFYMKSLLFLFIVCSSVLLYRNQATVTGFPEISRVKILNYSVLFITGTLVYLFASNVGFRAADSVYHIASMIKITDSGIITPRAALFSRASHASASYFYSPYHLILAVIKQISGAGQFFVWHHLKKILLFFIPICYYSLVKVISDDKRLAYFAFFFIVGLYFTDYYWYSLRYPYPRRFNRELLIPIFYLSLIRYSRHPKTKELMLLVISSMVMVTFHTMSVPFIIFNGLLYLLLLFIFKDGVKIFKERLFGFITIFLANLPFLIGTVLQPGFSDTRNAVKRIATIDKSHYVFGGKLFFTTDTLFGYLVILGLILTQSSSVLTHIMFAALMVVPVFLHFPLLNGLFSELFTTPLLFRMQDISIRPFFSIFFLIFLSFYGIKFLERLREKQKWGYFLSIIFLIGLNTNLIIRYFWVYQKQIGPEVLISLLLTSFGSKLLLVLLIIISAGFFYYLNRKKSFGSAGTFTFGSVKESHLSAVLFVPLLLSTFYFSPKIRGRVSVTQKVSPYIKKYTSDKNYIPLLLKHISSHEKPLSVTILVKKDLESWMIPQFIPQFTFWGINRQLFKNKKDQWEKVSEIRRRIYNDKVPITKTLELIYENKIDYIIAHGIENRKFAKNKNNFRLVYQDNDIYLYRVEPPKWLELLPKQDLLVEGTDANALMSASYKEHIGIVKLLLKNKAEVDTKNRYGETALMWACNIGNKKIVRILLNRGADFNIKDDNGWTALMWAAFVGHSEAMEALLGYGVNINTGDNSGTTSLMRAVLNKHAEAVRVLLSHGAALNIKDKEGRTALVLAAINGSAKVADTLLVHGAEVDAKDKKGNTALLWAFLNGHSDTVEVLLRHGADHIARDKEGRIALIRGAMKGYVKVIKSLLNHGVEVDAEDGKGNTALLWASLNGRPDTVEELLRHGADHRARDKEGRTALIRGAMRGGDVKVIKSLLNHGAEVDAKDKKGNTALLWASLNGRTDTVEVLLRHGADHRARDKEGRTALIRGAMKGHVKIMKSLLEHGAEVDTRDKKGNTALHWAAWETDDDANAIKVLLTYGAEVNAKGNDRATALNLALRKRHAKCVKVLRANGAK